MNTRPRLVLMCFNPSVSSDEDTPIDLHYRWIQYIATKQYSNGLGFIVIKNGGVGAWEGEHMNKLVNLPGVSFTPLEKSSAQWISKAENQTTGILTNASYITEAIQKASASAVKRLERKGKLYLGQSTGAPRENLFVGVRSRDIGFPR